MFETAVLPNNPAGKRVWTTVAGITGQCALVACAIVIPLLYPAGLPRPQALITWISPPVSPARPHVAPERAGPPRKALPTEIVEGRVTIPFKTPDRVHDVVDAAPEYNGPTVPYGLGDPNGDGVVARLLARVIATAPQTPRPAERHAVTAPAPVPAAPPRVRLGGVVKNAVLIERVEPVYPPLAIKTRVSGVVRLEGIIGVDGRIRELRVVEGHFMLTRAALDAVSRWVYKPTLLNGEPVEVIAPITVTFNLH